VDPGNLNRAHLAQSAGMEISHKTGAYDTQF
jgi:hypothetical protein